MVIQTKRMTVTEFDRFARLPENKDRLLEYVGGEVVEVVSNGLSSAVATAIIFFLRRYLHEHGKIAHVTGADGGYMVSGERYIPDVGVILKSRQAELDYREGYIPISPDLMIEIVSPGNADEDLSIKITNCLAAGTVVWVVYPDQEKVAVHRPGKPVDVLRGDDALSGDDILPGFTLKVADIFAEL